MTGFETDELCPDCTFQYLARLTDGTLACPGCGYEVAGDE